MLQLTTMVQDAIKGDAGVVADTSLINTRLDELEDKVSKMEQWLSNLQTIVDILVEDISPTGIDVAAAKEKEEAIAVTAEEKEEAEAATIAAAETAAINDVIAPRREKEENAKKISKAAADKIREVNDKKLAARVPLLSNKLNDFI